MIGCLDVYYSELEATAALVMFSNWSSEDVLRQKVLTSTIASEYMPGRFYERELPCLLSLLEGDLSE